jgi:hypothetical protein
MVIPLATGHQYSSAVAGLTSLAALPREYQQLPMQLISSSISCIMEQANAYDNALDPTLKRHPRPPCTHMIVFARASC